ncbi:DUF4097 family beta strand repeat-containing protein [Pontimicrobium aquaticum]|uniref:Adhesin domain-containing protein n=1 Tax=Pontimicrobium aquaticum TaxID=2565367 RepID=A0A4U0F4U4_9FLAO|nr:hypothetical protein [Pontimicrobium aquaticum]TJY37832.1 hypothetical protein E5167_00830 [Pontimicrobium aquaticum]
MKTKHLKQTITTLLFLLTLNITAQKIITVPMDNPNEKGLLEIATMNGSISIKGYSGNEVIVKGTARIQANEKEQLVNGLKKVSNTSIEFRVEKYGNEVNVRNSSKKIIDFEVQVPEKFSLKVTTHNQGEVHVENVNGIMDINNTNGKITLKDISGSVIASAMNGDIITNFLKVNPNEPMAFSCMNGDIDVTFPNSIKADMKINLEGGDIYSNFDWKIISSKKEPEKANPRKKGSQYVIKAKEWLTTSINGGGTEIQIKGYNTDVFVRKQ